LKSFEHSPSESFASLSVAIQQDITVKLFRETEAREMIKIKLFAANYVSKNSALL